MATLSDVQQTAFKVAAPDLTVDTDSAIFKKWLALKAAGTYIGVPLGAETPLDDEGGGNAQVFSSGVVLVWRSGDDVEVV
jgi:hypothetical protein